MALAAGTHLGPYEITGALGAGGMGEVYRAKDTKLNRDVALKILPELFTSDSDRLARFRREAQVLAALNHPNIAAIYGFEDSGATHALVMELVEGEDLSALIDGAPGLQLNDALPIARQIADALEAAHELGIVHRDLKPANIKVRADGTVKVLDFGLAKALDPVSRDPGLQSNPANIPTMTSPAMTAMGMILGTAAYMAPEQAKGRAVDKRADIWAFGVVLYEMLTGRRLFDAEDISETLAAVLTRDVSLPAMPADIPPRLRALLRDCLIRDPRQRLRDIGDARIVLDKILAGAPDDAAAPSAAAAAGPVVPAWRRALPWTAAGTLAVALGVALWALWAPWRVQQPTDRPLVRLDVDLGDAASFPVGLNTGSSIAISPDGTRLVYVSGAPTNLFIRRLDQPMATELRGTQGASRPIFSPDGQWVGFAVGNRLNRISVEGGAVVPLAEVDSLAGAAWAEDGSLIVGDRSGKGLLQFPAAEGSPTILSPLGNGEVALGEPHLLPGGKAILFVSATTGLGGADTKTIEVLTLKDGRRKVLARGGQSPHYLPSSDGTGYLVYVNSATLFAARFDLDTLEMRGTAVPVLEDVAYSALFGTGQFEVSRTGTLIYRRRTDAAKTVQWIDSTGKKEPLRATPAVYASSNPVLSADGSRIVLSIRDGGNEDLWVYDLRREAITRLTFGGINSNPVLSPDGQYVAFLQIGGGLFQARADGASPPQALTDSKRTRYPWSFAPDGKRLAYFETSQIWTVPLEDQGGQLKAGKPEQFLKSNFIDSVPAFSPDGRWLAYQSNESGKNELYVRAFPPPSSGQGRKWQVSNNGAAAPHWSRNGHELLYRSGDQVMTVSYSVKGDTFVAEKPRVWIARLGSTQWDLAPDGKRVAALIPETVAKAPQQDSKIVMLMNFADELRRRVPVKK